MPSDNQIRNLLDDWKRWTGKRHEIDTYQYVDAIPLRDTDDALLVNWCEITTMTEDSKVLYHNAFVTLLTINSENVLIRHASGFMGSVFDGYTMLCDLVNF